MKLLGCFCVQTSQNVCCLCKHQVTAFFHVLMLSIFHSSCIHLEIDICWSLPFKNFCRDMGHRNMFMYTVPVKLNNCLCGKDEIRISYLKLY